MGIPILIALRRGAVALAMIAAVACAPANAADEIFAAQRPEIARRLQALPALPGNGLLKARQGAFAVQRGQASSTLRERAATIDPAYLERMLGSEALAIDGAGTVVGAPATLNLFDDLTVHIVKLRVSRSDLGQQVLHAAVIDPGGGYATIVIDDGTVTATVVAGAHTVTIQPGAGGVHRIAELDTAAQPVGRDDDAVRPPLSPGDLLPAPAAPAGVERSSATTPTQLRILVVYTAQALALMPAMRANIALALADLNTTLANSQDAVQVTLVGIDQVNYFEAAGLTSSGLLNDAANQVGDFARIQSLRQVVGADLVSVIGSFDEAGSGNARTCGIAYQNDTLDQVSALSSQLKYGTSVVSVYDICLGSLAATFTHEVGHNLGGAHDRYVNTTAGPGPGTYNPGYVDLTGRFRDTMSYDSQCSASNVDCPRLQFYSNPNLTYNGRALGVADSLPAAADAARKVGEIAPFIARFHGLLAAPAAPVLAVLVSGSGTVTSTPAGINCGNTCSATVAANQQVTLTATAPAGWSLQQWSGACAGSATCTVTMSASKTVTATFVPTLRFGPIFSSAQANSQSFLRLVNTGAAADTAVVTLADYNSGAVLGQWTSPSIPAGTAPQYAISQIESALAAGTAKPSYYAVAVQSAMSGYAQHVLWKPSDGTLTNLSTCDAGVSASTSQVANVHSSLLDNGYPSSVAIANTGLDALTSLTLGIYDARNGTKLGTYVTGSIPAGGRLLVTVDAIEAGAHLSPSAGLYHYVIKVESTLTGFLQHLVNNQAVGVITDMTTVCSFGVPSAQSATVAVLQPGPIYSTAQAASQSFLRFVNTGTAAGTVAVTLRDYLSGAKLGQWISPTIPVSAAPQYPISQIESALSGSAAKPLYYSAQVESQITGSLAHVLWKPSDGTLTNLSTCDAGISVNAGQVANVHTSLLDSGYPSSLVIDNTSGSALASLTLGLYDARDGTKLGTYVSGAIPANGQVFLAAATLEAGAHITPTSGMFHYVVKVESAFTGFLQHLVSNRAVGVITDMTTICQLPARSVSYTDCTATSCPATVGVSTLGQLKQSGSYVFYVLSLTAGHSYTASVKGASSGNGTLTRPYLYILGPTNAVVGQGGGGGGIADAAVTFTPASSGTYTVEITTYLTADNTGTFVLTVQ